MSDRSIRGVGECYKVGGGGDWGRLEEETRDHARDSGGGGVGRKGEGKRGSGEVEEEPPRNGGGRVKDQGLSDPDWAPV